jgi:hypothetical protein
MLICTGIKLGRIEKERNQRREWRETKRDAPKTSNQKKE